MAARKVYFTEYSSELGPLTLAATSNGLCSIQFGKASQTYPGIKAWMNRRSIGSELVECSRSFSNTVQQLDEYFHRNRHSFDLDLDVYGTTFQRLVWKELASIPYGETCPYKVVAERIGAPKAVRAVGAANNKNPLPIIFPCHRVIGSNGSMVGYGGGLDKKEFLLKLEADSKKVSSL
ncbi:methylated-DNA--[protein]-cysteine S-methyltransferase [Alteribacillus sp. HJP-4]|uniref:methylated-DNA--[protein]-cysteine S-methyltransferase n=1 Tax=Alteribacillus sp. HJP-4 TaxID=2775394 RepID=UPI0035CD39C6